MGLFETVGLKVTGKGAKGSAPSEGQCLFWEKKDIPSGHNRLVSLSQMKFLTNYGNIVLKTTHTQKQDTKQHTQSKILVFETENCSFFLFFFLPPELFCSVSSECNCNSSKTSFLIRFLFTFLYYNPDIVALIQWIKWVADILFRTFLTNTFKIHVC